MSECTHSGGLIHETVPGESSTTMCMDCLEEWPDPCPHNSAVGIGRVTTFNPPWTGTIWECTTCHATGEDTADNTAIVWQQAGQQ